MAATCIALLAGAALVVLPTSSMTLRWMHTVEKTVWEEDYMAFADGLDISEARIEAVGAGMEPPAGALRKGRWWHYRPSLPRLTSVALANSAFAAGYTICWNAQCRPLASLIPRDTPVSIGVSKCTNPGIKPAAAAVR